MGAAHTGAGAGHCVSSAGGSIAAQTPSQVGERAEGGKLRELLSEASRSERLFLSFN